MTRRERMEARAARREEWAESRRAKAEAADSGARALAEGIPFGQPVMGSRDAAVRARRLRLSSHARALRALAQITAGQPRLAGAKGHLRSACGVNGSIPAPKVARPADPDRRERDIAHAPGLSTRPAVRLPFWSGVEPRPGTSR